MLWVAARLLVSATGAAGPPPNPAVPLAKVLDGTAMTEKFAPPVVTIRRYPASRICDVVVVARGKEMVLRCPSYSQAVKWAARPVPRPQNRRPRTPRPRNRRLGAPAKCQSLQQRQHDVAAAEDQRSGAIKGVYWPCFQLEPSAAASPFRPLPNRESDHPAGPGKALN